MRYDLQLFLRIGNISVCYLKKKTACICSYESVSTSINMLLFKKKKKGVLLLYHKYKKICLKDTSVETLDSVQPSIPYQDCTQAQRSAVRETLTVAHPNARIRIHA